MVRDAVSQPKLLKGESSFERICQESSTALGSNLRCKTFCELLQARMVRASAIAADTSSWAGSVTHGITSYAGD